MRIDGRNNDELRPIKFTRNFIEYPEGSVLVEMGKTKIIVTATIENKVPPFLRYKKTGWLTAEYAMLPASTLKRKNRDIQSLHQDGRSIEIQRLIGRALRTCIDLDKIGEKTIKIDADVIQADGGTRCAAITGGYIALCDAMKTLIDRGEITEYPIHSIVSAVSVGVVEGEVLLDLNFIEDSKADVDMNIIMNDRGEFIEIQGIGEGASFSRDHLDKMIESGVSGIDEIIYDQKLVLDSITKEIGVNL